MGTIGWNRGGPITRAHPGQLATWLTRRLRWGSESALDVLSTINHVLFESLLPCYQSPPGQEQRLRGDRDLSYLLLCPEPGMQEQHGCLDGPQGGTCEQLLLRTNPSPTTSQFCDASGVSASAPCPAQVVVWAGRGEVRLRTWGAQREDAPAWPPRLGPQGPGSEGQRHKSTTESPFPPRLLPLPGSGWGTPIVSLSGHKQTKKRLPGAAGRSLSPSSVSRSADWRRHPHSLSLPCSLEATWGFGQAYGYCKNSPSGQHCSSINLCSPRWLSERPIVGRLDGSIIGGCGTQVPPSEDVFQGMTPEPPHQEGRFRPFRLSLDLGAARHFTRSARRRGEVAGFCSHRQLE